MMNAILSGVQSEAATMRSPSPSRSSSSVTTTISPLAKAYRTSWIESAICKSRCFSGACFSRDRRRDSQRADSIQEVLYAFAKGEMVVVTDDDDLALGEGVQNFLDRVGHLQVSLLFRGVL